jgi:hypothetical protein
MLLLRKEMQGKQFELEELSHYALPHLTPT